MKATMPEPEAVTRQGKLVSVITRKLDTSNEDTLKNRVKEKSKECAEVTRGVIANRFTNYLNESQVTE